MNARTIVIAHSTDTHALIDGHGVAVMCGQVNEIAGLAFDLALDGVTNWEVQEIDGPTLWDWKTVDWGD